MNDMCLTLVGGSSTVANKAPGQQQTTAHMLCVGGHCKTKMVLVIIFFPSFAVCINKHEVMQCSKNVKTL